jgi:hypothetical protein
MTPTVGSQGLELVLQHCQNAKHLEPNATAEGLNKIISVDLQIFGRGAENTHEQVSDARRKTNRISWSSFPEVVRLRDDKISFRAPFPGDRIVCRVGVGVGYTC